MNDRYLFKAKLNNCPNCGNARLRKVHIISRRLPWWWYIMCDNCKWCGETRLFFRRAVKVWNEQEKLKKR